MTTASIPLVPSVAIDRRFQVLAGALLVQLILGTVYGYSVFWQPLERAWFPPVVVRSEATGTVAAREDVAPVDIVASAAEADRIHAMRLGYLKYAFGICLLSFAGSMVLAGRLQDVRGPRFTAALGGVLLAAGFLIAGQAQHLITFYICHGLLVGVVAIALLLAQHLLLHRVDAHAYPIVRFVPHSVLAAVVVIGVVLGDSFVSNDWKDRMALLWAAIGLLAGAGIGFAYVCPIAALVKWFPRHKGLMAGVAVAGFGLGAMIFSQKWVFGAVGFIERYGIDVFFRVHAMVCLFAVCGGAMLLSNPPEGFATGAGMFPSGSATAKRPASNREWTWRQTIQSRDFLLIWLMFFSGALAGLMVIGILKPFAGAQLVGAAQASGMALDAPGRDAVLLRGAAAVAWLAVFNAIGRVFWGWASDRIGRRNALATMLVLQAATMLLLARLDTPLLLAVGASWVGFNFGGNFAIFPSLTAERFGSANLGANYGWVFTSYGIAGVIGVALGNAALGWSGSYFAAFAIAAALCLASAGLTRALKPA